MTLRVVVMGVAGSGKSTIARRIADQLDARFLEGDDAHLPASVAKMAAGEPLTDEDRWPWLARIRQDLADAERLVVTCSALKRRYRDLLRRAGGVRFVQLELSPEVAEERVRDRTGHFARADLVASQFDALEAPGDDERDVALVDAEADVDTVVARAVDALATARTDGGAEPLVADGGTDRTITPDQLAAHVLAIVRDLVLPIEARRILLVPPDHTRLHSRAGEITAALRDELVAAGCEVGVLPATGTHRPMDDADSARLFGDRVAAADLLPHDWRTGVVEVGEISAAEVEVLSGRRLHDAVPVAVARELLAGWDLVISVGQVVPHEVIGMANFTKNLVIGLGGSPTIDRTHFLGAAVGMERLMGRADGPVREVVDAAFDRFLAPRVDVLWVLTVVEATQEGTVHRGLYVGRGSSAGSGGAAYRAAAAVAAEVNVEHVTEPLPRVSCWMDPTEFRTTWLANKAVYRTRMAIADAGELIVLAPGVAGFGEDPAVDALIRRHGYRGTDATLRAIDEDPELAANLGAAAHLIHGSSEGRFAITYCTDPDAGGLMRAEVESVGYRWRPLQDELARLGVDGSTPSGPRVDAAGVPFEHIANPALGLWARRG